MATTPGGTYYAASSELVSSWPATSLDLANQLESRFAAKAALASPALTGTPTAPTAAAGTNTTQIATTAFVQTAGGLVLVTPSSIANSGGSASASGGQVTFTGVTSISLNGVFTSTYSAYRVLLSQGAADGTATRILHMRLRASGTDDASAASYNLNQVFQYGASTVGGSGVNGTAFNLCAFSGTDKNLFMNMDVSDPQQTWRTPLVGAAMRYQSDVNAWVNSTFGGVHTNATAYDGFTLYPGSGNFSGVIRVYGYKNS